MEELASKLKKMNTITLKLQRDDLLIYEEPKKFDIAIQHFPSTESRLEEYSSTVES